MLYDLSNEFDRLKFKKRVNTLYYKNKVVKLEDITNRSLSQNSYLHAILSYFALQTGNTLEYVKRVYFKEFCNKDLFVIEKEDEFTKTPEKVLKSSAKLSSEEMSLAINRFRNWAASEDVGVYIPSSEEHEYLKQMMYEIERNGQWMQM